jgi:drug/metabolite transporter (DMT)-like permease
MSGPSTTPAVLSNPVRGVLWMLLSTACFALMSVFIRPASSEMHPFEALLFRNAIGLAVMAPWLTRAGFGALRTPRVWLQLLLACLILVAMMTWFYSVTVLPYVNAVALSFTAPLFSSLLAALILHEIIRWRRWSAIILGFLGALLVVRPGAGMVNVNSVIALLNPLAWAGAVIVIKILSRTGNSNAIVAYMFLMLFPMSIVPAAFVWTEPPLASMPWVVLVGLSGAAGHFCSTRAIALAPTSLVMPIEYLRLPFLGLIGFVSYQEIPDRWTLLGSAVIVAAALYVGHRESKLERERAEAMTPSPDSPAP